MTSLQGWLNSMINGWIFLIDNAKKKGFQRKPFFLHYNLITLLVL